MAPEVLSETMIDEDFEAYKRADIYSFSLVMWETAQCTIKDGESMPRIIERIIETQACLTHMMNVCLW